MKQRLIVGISGASGAIYGIRLLEILQTLTEIDTHLIISKAAKRTIVLETDYKLDQETKPYAFGTAPAAASARVRFYAAMRMMFTRSGSLKTVDVCGS